MCIDEAEIALADYAIEKSRQKHRIPRVLNNPHDAFGIVPKLTPTGKTRIND